MHETTKKVFHCPQDINKNNILYFLFEITFLKAPKIEILWVNFILITIVGPSPTTQNLFLFPSGSHV